MDTQLTKVSNPVRAAAKHENGSVPNKRCSSSFRRPLLTFGSNHKNLFISQPTPTGSNKRSLAYASLTVSV
jgi:hypothetical protein